MSPLLTAIAVDGAGSHPAAWRERKVDAETLLSAEHLVKVVRLAENAGVDFVTLDDSLAPAGTHGGDFRARLDALAALARVAPTTDRIGLVPTVTTTHTEPFHLQAAVATLDWVSAGRAGWQVQVSATQLEADHVGRRPVADPSELWGEATEVAEVSRLLWDSWEDDAEIRDTDTGRFIDRDRLHYTDFVGTNFSVKGPSIVPRSPQGQPPIVVTLAGPESLPTVAQQADVVLIAEPDADAARAALATVRDAISRCGRDLGQIRVLASSSVLIEDDPGTARTRLERLNARARRRTPVDRVGTAARLVESIQQFAELGFDGIHLRPAVIDTDLPKIADQLFPALRAAGMLGQVPSASGQLRERLGLHRPANHFAANGTSSSAAGINGDDLAGATQIRRGA